MKLLSSLSLTIVLTGGQFTFTETTPLQAQPCSYGKEIINGEVVCRCAPDEVRFSINLVTDNYPQETEWTISTCDGDEMIQGSYASKNTEHSDSYCLAGDQAYTFEIIDTYGDGICCGYGGGNYALYVEGLEVFRSEGTFGSSEVTKVNGDCTASLASPSISPVASLVTDETSVPSFSSHMPSLILSNSPSLNKSGLPSSIPTSLPSNEYTKLPSLTPSNSPSLQNSNEPSSSPFGGFTLMEIKPLQAQPCSYGKETFNGEVVCRCAPDEVRFSVNLVTDNYPQETKWTLSTCEGDEILQSSYASRNTEHNDSYCIAGDQAYTFEIIDTYGDGICCGYGEGNYTLFVDGIELFRSEGAFRSREVTKVNGDCSSHSERPNEAPSTIPSVKTRIDLPTTSPTNSLIPSMKPSISHIPSKIPTLLPSNTLSLFPSSAPSPTTELFGTTCIDDESYEFTLSNGNTADCTWFLHYNPLIAFRRNMYCNGNTLLRCKKSCGRCSSDEIPLDDENFQFIIDGELQTCSWISDSSNSDMYNVLSRQKSYCQQSYNGVLIADKCKLSCYEAAVLPKKGLLMNKNAAKKGASHFGGFISWYANYKQEPYEGTFHREFIDQHGIEFVPMFAQNWLDHPDGTKRCFYEDYDVNGYVLQRNDDFPVCTQQDAITILQESKAKSSPNSIPMTYVMGWNEQYINPSTKMTPKHMAYYYAKYLQPAAKASGLKIVSPTLHGGSVAWFAEFLDHCYKAKGDAQNPCDIFSMEKFAIHTYDCRYDLWTNWYSGNGSRLVKKLVNELEARLGNVENWENYVLARPLWITETSCFNERTSPSFNFDNSYETPKANAKEQCERITGQSQSIHGDGSLVAMENISTIERYAWWTTWHTKMKPHYLTYKDGTITQVGEAYKRIGDSSVNCEYPGTKVFADDISVVITSPATLLDCQVTNTKMVKLMKLGGSATFTVNVPLDGNYAINVSYISEEPRNLKVKVNKNAVDPNDVFAKTFNFYSTGDNSWCEGGTGSTHVVPLELKKFKAGSNTITFGNDGDEDSPVIEWIALVPKQD
ncbi:hypothetical protein CTEN210_06468 [Chaetoceros tenuissimus]|uniref:Asl1-like glycosyl hydrolase catalytic domain-containing protein n=1 Tax=Chaetoceros tenuissimus TaxID=426638 RepID=A0AAD3CPW6_9STRA|nr:hypothetical protein CTEN210_06466 [Chaetoceros tenuissimus]GFH49992.1 hypothetical protein CTEN210_06468 [Chaetoceros tenuissimus]